jgi:hypothetical protein
MPKARCPSCGREYTYGSTEYMAYQARNWFCSGCSGSGRTADPVRVLYEQQQQKPHADRARNYALGTVFPPLGIYQGAKDIFGLFRGKRKK